MGTDMIVLSFAVAATAGLGQIEGAAITNVRIKGVQHEFTAIPGVWEDVTHILLNLKEIPLKLHSSQPQIVRIDRAVAISTAEAALRIADW